jgi:uncharacterized lipoprotein YmbA
MKKILLVAALALGLSACATGDNELQHLFLKTWLHYSGPIL